MDHNESTNGKVEKALVKLQREYEAKTGGKPPSKTAVEAIKKRMLAAEKAYDDALAAVEKAREAKDEIAREAMLLCGTKQRLNLGGEIGVVAPTARGERVFYKRVDNTDVL